MLDGAGDGNGWYVSNDADHDWVSMESEQFLHGDGGGDGMSSLVTLLFIVFQMMFKIAGWVIERRWGWGWGWTQSFDGGLGDLFCKLVEFHTTAMVLVELAE